MEYNNIYEIRKAWCAELGIDASAAQNIYEVSLLLLDYYSGGTPVPPTPPTPPTIDYNGLILTALEDNCSVTWYHGQYPEEMYTSTDGVNWESWDGSAISMDEGDKLCLKGLLHNGARYPSNIYITGKVNAEGNIMSLTDDGACSALTIEAQQFQYLFSGCTGLEISGLTIPATEVKVYGCRGMFSGCTSITKAPELHATIVAASGYSFMFQGCTSLTSAPSVLPATSLSGYTDEAKDVYRGMFAGCTSLTGAPVLCATTLSTSCYCGMFHGCTSLTTAPELPATTLASHCYDNMFAGCSSLSSITTYAQDISASMALNNWLKDVASEGDFYNYGGANYSSGKSGIPTGWTEHNSYNT